MKIKKKLQSIGVLGRIFNTKSSSDKDTYSCNYVNNITEKISEKNILSIRVSTQYDQTTDKDMIKFGTIISSIGDKLTISNNGIRIGSGVKKVLINSNIILTKGNETSGDLMETDLMKNGTQVLALNIINKTTNWQTLNAPNLLIAVEEGDLLQIQLWNNNHAAARIYATSYLTVEVVE